MRTKKQTEYYYLLSEIEYMCHDRGRRLLLAQADRDRKAETLRRVVTEARRQHSAYENMVEALLGVGQSNDALRAELAACMEKTETGDNDIPRPGAG